MNLLNLITILKRFLIYYSKSNYCDIEITLSAPDDLKNPTRLKSLIEDLLNLRASKMQERINSIKTLDDVVSVRDLF